MGGRLSTEETKDLVRSKFSLEAFSFSDLVLDNCLKEFSGLQSNAILKEKSAFLFENFPTRMRDFVTQAKALTGYPNAVGIGAFFILWMIEANLARPDDCFSTTLNSMFAREKGNEVFNIVRAYYTRFTMFVHDSTKLLEETKIYERQLGDQLTRVMNTLLDGNMSTALFKVWVNGAAFHVQMLIHIVRLERGDRQPVRAAIKHYQRELGELIDEFQRFKVKQFKIGYNTLFLSGGGCHSKIFSVSDFESKQNITISYTCTESSNVRVTPEIVTEVLFEQDEHIPRLINYFSQVQQNMDGLVNQNENLQFEFDE